MWPKLHTTRYEPYQRWNFVLSESNNSVYRHDIEQRFHPVGLQNCATKARPNDSI